MTTFHPTIHLPSSKISVYIYFDKRAASICLWGTKVESWSEVWTKLTKTIGITWYTTLQGLSTPLNSHTKYLQRSSNPRISASKQVATMAPISLSDIISSLPSEDSWGPPTSTETTLNGVPYAPYSKGDKLGRMADWTTEGKDGRDGRGGRQQYNRNYRGTIFTSYICCYISAI